jgi:hypothetical protein
VAGWNGTNGRVRNRPRAFSEPLLRILINVVIVARIGRIESWAEPIRATFVGGCFRISMGA